MLYPGVRKRAIPVVPTAVWVGRSTLISKNEMPASPSSNPNACSAIFGAGIANVLYRWQGSQRGAGVDVITKFLSYSLISRA